uniref:Uncharacterized protein n=1 Tax=Anguilla anguilla TaxID=7936 RepID=A0A0E9WEY3_ANGAN
MIFIKGTTNQRMHYFLTSFEGKYDTHTFKGYFNCISFHSKVLHVMQEYTYR